MRLAKRNGLRKAKVAVARNPGVTQKRKQHYAPSLPQAITHEAIAMTSQYEDFSRNDTSWSALLYKSANASAADVRFRG
jgi:hypothetical protein